MNCKTKIITVNKNKLKYQICGRGQPLLLLHGFGVSPLICRPAINELAKDYLTIVPHLSELPSFSNLAILLSRLFDELKIKEKIVIVGHSMGAMLATEFVIKYPERVRKLIISDGLIFPLKKNFFRTASDIICDTLYNFFNPNDWKNLFLSFYEVGRFYLRNPSIFKCQSDYVMKSSVENKLKNIKIDTLILWGKSDKVIPVKNARKIKEKIPAAKLIIFPGNHIWLLQKPRLFKSAIDDSLK